MEEEDNGPALGGVLLGTMLGAAMWLVILALAYVCVSGASAREPGGAPMRRAPFDAGDMT